MYIFPWSWHPDTFLLLFSGPPLRLGLLQNPRTPFHSSSLLPSRWQLPLCCPLGDLGWPTQVLFYCWCNDLHQGSIQEMDGSMRIEWCPFLWTTASNRYNNKLSLRVETVFHNMKLILKNLRLCRQDCNTLALDLVSGHFLSYSYSIFSNNFPKTFEPWRSISNKTLD